MPMSKEKQLIYQVISWFSPNMLERLKKKLYKNAYKGGWRDEDFEHLIKRLREEVDELEQACCKDNREDIMDECTDVIAFTMFIADNARRN